MSDEFGDSSVEELENQKMQLQTQIKGLQNQLDIMEKQAVMDHFGSGGYDIKSQIIVEIVRDMENLNKKLEELNAKTPETEQAA